MSINSSTRVALRGISAAMLVFGLQVAFASDLLGTETGTETPRMATFESAGETSFALSLNPQFQEQRQLASDVAIYIDTSASQSGIYKRDSIETVLHLLQSLNKDDRVKIFAVDLDPIALTKDFVAPGSDEVAVALENIQKRVALGSTDIELMLNSAVSEFNTPDDRNKNIVYIGDGISRAGILHTEAFTKAVRSLCDNEIAVSSYAIGPDRNVELMAALANQTGGNVFVDSDDAESMRRGAIGIAQTVHGMVFWPKSATLSESVVEIYPQYLPPLRADRDTIMVGTLSDRSPVDFSIGGLINGVEQTMKWSIQPEANNVDFAFLPTLMKDARKDAGVTMPTVGSEGLREYARMLSENSAELTELGAQALASGNTEFAKQLADAALTTDPANTTADVLAMAANYRLQDDDPFGLPNNKKPADQPAPQDPVDLPTEPGQEQPGQEPVVVPDTDPSKMTLIAPSVEEQSEQLLKEVKEQSGNLITSQEDRIRIINDRAKKQIQFELKRAREELRSNPDAAIERLKNVIEVVDQTADLYPNVRQELRFSLESALQTARREKLEYDEAQAIATENSAIALSIERDAIRLERREEEISELINRFNSLLVEGKYDEARAVTETAYEIDPENPAVVAANEKARVVRNLDLLLELRRQKAEGFFDSLYQTELASIPFSGNPPMVFPDPIEWQRKKLRRKKYENIRLSGSENEEKILRALEEPSTLIYDETPWNEVEEELERQYKINIVLGQSAKDDSLTEDEPMSVNLRGIRLKNALRLMLKEKNATFIVRNEVLLIISLDDAEDTEYFVTNVYNVGDLVAPRFNPGGGLGGGGFGGGAGGGLGGGGGFGGGGGGFGGGGGGFGGGGGGVFCIQESGRIDVNASPTQPVATINTSKPKAIELPVSNMGPDAAWNTYFSSNFASPEDVRETVRQMMKEEKAEEIVALIRAALRNDQLQPWMYEAMVISMQIADMPKADVERALMSAVDLSDDPNEAMYIAKYMSKNGMEKRAIRMLKDFAVANPTRTEPFVLGLRAAQKINDLDGIQWATVGIFGQEWPDHPEVVKQAKYASDAIRVQLKKQGRDQELADYEARLTKAFERDCFINVSWTGDADIDLFVAEPGGTICSRLRPRTTAGGISMGDNFSAKPGESGMMSEQYILPKGFAGNYQLLVRRVWGEVTSGKVTVSIHNHYRSDHESSMTKQVELDDKGALVMFALDQGRRTEPLEQHAIKTVVKEQMANRHILAQQLSGASAYGGSYAGGGNGLVAGGPNPLLAGLNDALGRGVVGYQPVITQIQEGTFMTVNHATTADRLYVMVSVSPTFSQITEVETFNILGTADTAQGLAGGAGGGAGGGGGGFGGAGGGAGGGGVF